MNELHEYSIREQTEFAAKAIGLELLWPSVDGLPPVVKETLAAWNPRHDDGDSLRLSVLLAMQIEHAGPYDGPADTVLCRPRGRAACSAYREYGNDLQEATRLAIFESAALVGMELQAAAKGKTA